ncbi:TPA: hypothetical protein ACOEND_000392 [Stenotrophomonas maltophilia]
MRTRTYAALLIVLLLSVGLSLIVPESATFFRALAAVPGVAAVAGGVFLLLRDELAYQRQLERDSNSNAFHVAAQSHMAKVLFDKHVEFAEAYAAAAHTLVSKLFRDGPTEGARNIDSLDDVRRSHALWISAGLAERLDTFERQFVDIGAAMILWGNRSTRDSLPEDHLKKVFDTFYDLTGIARSELADQGVDTHTHSVQKMMAWLQGLLGVEQLTAAREKAVAGASSAGGPTRPSNT